MAGIVCLTFICSVCNSFVYNIPAVNYAREIVFEVAYNLFNVILKTAAHGFSVYKVVFAGVSFAEKPVWHVSVPNKNVAAYANSVFLGIFCNCKKIT